MCLGLACVIVAIPPTKCQRCQVSTTQLSVYISILTGRGYQYKKPKRGSRIWSAHVLEFDSHCSRRFAPVRAGSHRLAVKTNAIASWSACAHTGIEVNTRVSTFCIMHVQTRRSVELLWQFEVIAQLNGCGSCEDSLERTCQLTCSLLQTPATYGCHV